MKTKLAILFTLLYATIFYGQTFNQQFATINSYAANGSNPHDFIFSYDVINNVATCNNNFEVVSKVDYSTNFNFRIFVGDIAVYTGSVTLLPRGRFFFNDAYTNCNSTNLPIRVVII